MTILELAAPTSQPVLESMPDFAAHLPAHTAAPQSWVATVTDAKFQHHRWNYRLSELKSFQERK